MSQPDVPPWRSTLRKRVWLLAAIATLWAAGIEARLAWLQVAEHDSLAARATSQRRQTVPVPGQRGEILDRHGRVLAVTVEANTLRAVPGEIEHPAKTAEMLCRVLDGCTDAIRVRMQQQFQSKKGEVYVAGARQVSSDQARRIDQLRLPGMTFLPEFRRYYPNMELAAHLLGWVGVEGVGLAGVELAYDSRIRGRQGAVIIETDNRHQEFSRIERSPGTGATIELTIDAFLQHVAERELHEAVVENRAIGGSAVILDPATGEILALANVPTFDLNQAKDVDPIVRRNRAAQDVYEPGSTFKIVTASAALEEHVVAPGEFIDASAGSIRIGNRTVSDVVNHGVLSFTDVIVESSNVGAIKIGERLGAERLGRYVGRFGFGTRLCPDTPGENAGIVWPASTWTESAVASVSMGYEIGVTPLQMVTAASTVANLGVMLQPHAVRALIDGSSRTESRVRETRRAVSAETAATLVGMMEQVVERGTGRAAAIPGFTVAGKTGTATKLVGGQYSKRDFYASFVGFVPSRQPAFAIVVMIDTPRAGKYFGGDVAAPVFRRIAEAALRHHGIPPTINPAPPVVVASGHFANEGVPAMKAAAPVRGFASIEAARDSQTIPDLRGLAAREAIRRLVLVGMVPNLRGDGIVVDQDPDPGLPVERGRTCRLWLERVGALISPNPFQQ